MTYEFHYWPGSPGRGEFVRLSLEEAGVDYIDVARKPEAEGGGRANVLKLMEASQRPPFAPPFLKIGDEYVSHVANILMWLGAHHDLAPKDEAGRLWANALQLNITDFLKEVHDTHHPIAVGLYYEDQKPEAKRRTEDFLKNRAPKFLGYFERVLGSNDGKHLVGSAVSYPDISVYHLITGLRHAFPNAMKRLERDIPLSVALRDTVEKRPRISAYLASPRRLPFDNVGVFRRYSELDE